MLGNASWADWFSLRCDIADIANGRIKKAQWVLSPTRLDTAYALRIYMHKNTYLADLHCHWLALRSLS